MPARGGQTAQPSSQGQAPQHQQGWARPPNPPPRTPEGRAYVMWKEEVEDTPNIVIGNFTVKTHHVEVLFDFGATHSFISARLVSKL